MSSFDLERFVSSPTMEEINTLRKVDLLAISQHYKLSASNAMDKSEIRGIVVQYLKDEELILDTTATAKRAMTGEELLELRRLEFQEKERAREAQLRMKELELKEKELTMQIKLKELEVAGSTPVEKADKSFDVSKHIRFVPTFSETEVDKYFLHFEKVAKSLKWPLESWTLLLQSTLVGKAREIYSALSIEESCQYDMVKTAVLKAYELVPEAYRQKFRNTVKQDTQTYVEFARNKETLLARWCASKNIDKDFEKLREMLLIEEFKKCLPNEIKTYLDEKKVENLNQAAVLADDYTLTHKNSFGYRSQISSQLNRQAEPFSPSPSARGQIDHRGSSKHSQRGTRFNPQRNQTLPAGPKCFHCQKRGHVIADCWYLRGTNQGSTKPTMTTVKAQTRPTSDCVQTPCEEYKPFISYGSVSLPDSSSEMAITILRDTGANQSLLLEDALPLSERTFTGADILIQGVELEPICVPLHEIKLQSDIVSGLVKVGVRPSLPVVGVGLILGNDLAGGKVIAEPCVTSTPVSQEETKGEVMIYPACAVTRAMTQQQKQSESANCPNSSSIEIQRSVGVDTQDRSEDPGNRNPLVSRCHTSVANASDTNQSEQGQPSHTQEDTSCDTDGKSPLTRSNLIVLQEEDPSLSNVREQVVSESEAAVAAVCFYKKGGILMRKWRPLDSNGNEEWRVVNQIVVPEQYRDEVLHLAHEAPMAGHLGINKTYRKILQHFYWPGLKKDVKSFCQSCCACQMVGKPNQMQPVAPLKPIPAFDEPFSQVIIDCVGPLPKTKAGHQYLLTIMCASTRFPEAIPLRNIRAPNIVKHLIRFFTLVGLPKTVQSDQGSNFLSGIFQQVMHQLGIQQNVSSAYHPQSQGALERFHQTLKNMMKTYCHEQQKDWDEGIPILLFAVRESVQESLGFSPFELLYGRDVRGPLKILKEHWLTEDESGNLLEEVCQLRYRMTKARELAATNLKAAQGTMKTWYDKRARKRSFAVGDEVLVLLPIPGNALQARYSGPYIVDKKLNDVDYIINTPGRRKRQQLCHINMLKLYQKRKDIPKSCATVTTSIVEGERPENGPKLSNSEILSNLGTKLNHLLTEEQADMEHLLLEFRDVFGDVPSCTTGGCHDVDVGEAAPVKQHPYRINPIKLEQMRKEIDYMLENKIIEPSNSDWSSPCLLVPKPDGTFRFCTDFRKLNALTKTDSYPLPRIEDCIDRIGKAKYVTKFDLLKGYWQVPLTDRAKRLSAFVTPDGLYQYRVMPFGMKNAPATFQRMINQLIGRMENCEAYIDDVVVYSDTWEDHLAHVCAVLMRFAQVNLTVNLHKSEFGHAEVIFLGHVVGNGQVKPLNGKIKSIMEYPVPTSKRELMRFLGMAGYYRRFCQNFSVIAAPLTNLLRKGQGYVWSPSCQDAFAKVKAVLLSNPVLLAPDFQQQFLLMVDASDQGQNCTYGEVRLIGHSSAYAGFVEFCNQSTSWVPLCGAGWTLKSSQVVCKQLKYAGTWTYSNIYSNVTSFGLRFNSQNLCNGSESTILECLSAGIMDDLECSSPIVVCRRMAFVRDVRLINDFADDGGEVEVFLNSSDHDWVPLCNSTVTSSRAKLLCKRLGYKSGNRYLPHNDSRECLDWVCDSDDLNCQNWSTRNDLVARIGCDKDGRGNESSYVLLSDSETSGVPIVLHEGRRSRICVSHHMADNDSIDTCNNNMSLPLAICQHLGYNQVEIATRNVTNETRQLPILVGACVACPLSFSQEKFLNNFTICIPDGDEICNMNTDIVLKCRNKGAGGDDSNEFGVGAIVGIIIGVLLVLLFLSPFIFSCSKSCYKSYVKSWLVSGERTSTHPTGVTNQLSKTSEAREGNSVALSTSEAEPSTIDTGTLSKKQAGANLTVPSYDMDSSKYNDSTL